MRPRFPFSINSCSQGINNPIVTQCTMYKAIRQISEGNAIQTNLYRDWKLFIFEISSIKAIGSSCIFFSGSPPPLFSRLFKNFVISRLAEAFASAYCIWNRYVSSTDLDLYCYVCWDTLIFLKKGSTPGRWSNISMQQIRTGNRHLRLRE